MAITYRGWGDARSLEVPKFQVLRIIDGRQVKTDPKAAWYDHGCKTFYVGHSKINKNKPKVLEEAKLWVADNLGGPRLFIRNRLGDYVETFVNRKYPIRKTP